MKLKLTLPNNGGSIVMDVPNGTVLSEFGTPDPNFTLPTAAVLTPAQQAAKAEALKTALPMAQSNPDQLRKLDAVFYELMTSRITDPDVIRRYQESQVGTVCMPFQALVSVAPAGGIVDVLVGIWIACQEALKTVK